MQERVPVTGTQLAVEDRLQTVAGADGGHGDVRGE